MEYSSGAVVFYIENDVTYFVMIQELSGNWGFPKGHCEGTETLKETAVREIQEEIDAEVTFPIPFERTIKYVLYEQQTEKEVTYYLAQTSTRKFTKADDILDLQVCPYSEADQLLGFTDLKTILRDAYQEIARQKRRLV
ncbi:MAG: NUDIX domain-containing protein [Erysipelotrichaceae bacterium]|nr:NUDIX domain-containing protein [Erysipelotrichaceae bacterium]